MTAQNNIGMVLPDSFQNPALSNRQQVGFPYEQQGYPTRDNGADEIDLNPIKLFWYLVHYRWLFASMVILGLVIGFVFTWTQTPLYRSSAKLEIQGAQARVIQDLEVVSQSMDVRLFETARQKILSRDLARRVVYALNLQSDDKFLSPPPSFSLMNIVRRTMGTSVTEKVDDLNAAEREELAVSILQEGITAEIVRNTSVMTVSFSHPDAKVATDVANQAARSFIDQAVDKVGETSNLARQFIQQQVIETKTKLETSERELVDYAQQAGITITGADGTLIQQNLSEINKALGEAIQKRLDAEREAVLAESGSTFALTDFADSKGIQEIKGRLAELQGKYQEKLATLKPGFPEMRSLAAQIREIERQISSETNAIGKSVTIKAEQAREREAALKAELTALEARQSEFQRKNIRYTILKRDADSYRSQYDSLITKLNDIGVGADLRTTNASIIDLAIEPISPYTPRIALNLALSLVLFMLLAAAIVFILELINNTFAIPDQVESDLKLPVLGIIPYVEETDFDKAMMEEKSGISEAYRTLRTSVQFTGTEDNLRTILVTSSRPSEGKSTTAYKLARDFSAIGRRVLVIDADMRKPRMHRLFATNNIMGLSNLLTNVIAKGDIDSIFCKTDDPNITFLPAGTIPPNPADLLLSPKMAMALDFFRKKYDIVIIDTCPVMGLADAPILARMADATLMVVSSKSVSRQEAKKALSRLRAVGANVVGAAMTRFRIDQVDYNYAYRYMSYNYYSYGDATPKIGQAHIETNKQNTNDGIFGKMGRIFGSKRSGGSVADEPTL
jgi:polysaccharide biosynthesis transport protein